MSLDDPDPFMHWTTDSDGNSVYRGLTAAETEWLLAQDGKPWSERQADRYRARALREKHEIARLAAVGTKAQIEAEKPPKH